MSVEQALQNYFNSGQQTVEGWFYPLDMLFFSQIDHTQKSSGIAGDICELGVYQAKSLIYLKLLSINTEVVFAFDLYPDDLLEKSQANVNRLANYAETGEVRWVVGGSNEHTVDTLKAHFNKPLRMLHIDAGHEYHEVLQSLYAFTPFVSNQGVIIMDDYQDRDFPGVESAVHRFTQEHVPRRFVPFAAGANKMYLCTPAMAHHYQRGLIQHQSLMNQCRVTRIENYFVLIATTKLPMANDQIEQILSSQVIPYQYPVDQSYLQQQANDYGQFSPLFNSTP